MDSIFAVATAPGRGGVAIVRVSGPAAGEALRRLCKNLPKPRQAHFTVISEGEEIIDRGLALWFPAPASFTGEDVAELHLHGGRAVVARALSALARMDGLRPAEPGEFSRRAFLNGRMDLTEAEGLADLVDAETEAQRRQALRQMGGALKRRVENWRERMIGLMALQEATIDFSEEDLPPDLADRVFHDGDRLVQEIKAALSQYVKAERLREGFHVAILGAPNTGKSSLLNRLAGREAAIVSERAGTTRDIIEVHLELGGFPVILSDTAGLREEADEIEAEGIRRARERAESADLKILLFDASVPVAGGDPILALRDSDSLIVANKIDLAKGGLSPQLQSLNALPLSALAGEGLDALERRLAEMASERMGAGGDAGLNRLRHRRALEDCLEALERLDLDKAPELAAEDLRQAARALGRITGSVDVEDILDSIFRDFCIGK